MIQNCTLDLIEQYLLLLHVLILYNRDGNKDLNYDLQTDMTGPVNVLKFGTLVVCPIGLVKQRKRRSDCF